MTIKQISFDVWNTLIEPNPLFAQERDLFLSDILNFPIDVVRSIYKNLKIRLDRYAEIDGTGLDSDQVYRLFMFEIAQVESGYSKADFRQIRIGLEEIFTKHPPIVRSETISVLNELSSLRLTITSNTNFIRGSCLFETVLKSMATWGDVVFSDYYALSKPHPKIWKQVIYSAACACVKPEEIIHVGDNRVTDGSCVQQGINYFHVQSPKELPLLLDYLRKL